MTYMEELVEANETLIQAYMDEYYAELAQGHELLSIEDLADFEHSVDELGYIDLMAQNCYN